MALSGCLLVGLLLPMPTTAMPWLYWLPAMLLTAWWLELFSSTHACLKGEGCDALTHHVHLISKEVRTTRMYDGQVGKQAGRSA